MAQPLPDLALPAELLREIVKDLALEDQRTLTLTSRTIRSQVLPFIFGKLRYTGYQISTKCRNINRARDDIKSVIRKLELHSHSFAIREDDNSVDVFELLKNLPNLQAFEYHQLELLIAPSEMSQLVSSLRHAPLVEFGLDTGLYETVRGMPVVGFPGLQKLSINWSLGDNPDQPDSSVAHLFSLIQPSLTTLVELAIDFTPEELCAPLDLHLLKPAGTTLQVFAYTLQRHDEQILDTIPEIFPNLTELAITWEDVYEDHSVLWKDAHVSSIAKNIHLINLTLSSDFEVNTDDEVRADEDYAWFIRCYRRRLDATEALASACAKLQQCNWVQMRIGSKNSSMIHPFIIEERIADRKQVRLVRGIKQNWMGRDHRSWIDNELVKCRLEDLPGNIIGENDPSVEENEE